MARLDLEALSKVFPGGRAADDIATGDVAAGGIVAVRDLSLSVAEGELLVLLGPSGCGKTTTLRLVAGLERATTGDVRIAGASVSRLSPEKRDVAMVFPRGALYPHLTAHENLAWGARLRDRQGWSELWGRLKVGGWLKTARLAKAAERSAERDRRVRRVADQLGLGALLDRLPSQLSDGQRQRVALGRAMVRRPSVYLMDEPLTGLDAPLRNQLRRELKEWHQSTGATIVYVTHDQTEALLLGDRVAVMNAGELQQVGSPRDVYEHPGNRFVAGFIGSPPMNLMEGELDEEQAGQLRFRAGGWSLPVPGWERLRGHRGRRVVLGVRPEHVAAIEGERQEVKGNEARSGAPGDETVAEQVVEIDGVVRLAESAGDLRLVHVRPASKPSGEGGEPIGTGEVGDCLLVKWSAAEMPRPGDVLRLSLDPRQVHWFDAASGANLTLPQSG